MSIIPFNACTFCRKAKRKCSKGRPTCSNCLRLRKPCWHIEDTIDTHFENDSWKSRSTGSPEAAPRPSLGPLSNVFLGDGRFGLQTLNQSAAAFLMQTIGSLDHMRGIASDFFSSTHQRIPTLSRIKFHAKMVSLATAPRADFAVLCLSVYLIQQYPSSGKASTMQSPLYLAVKYLINLLEATEPPSLDLAQSKILVAFYEMGHALHAAAYTSIAACARTARALGLHRKKWRDVESSADKLALEEERRTWWAVTIMERFIGLCNGDAALEMEDSERADPLPIEDLVWSEGSDPATLERLIGYPPSLETPFDITVGQMARECQVSYLVGQVVRHVFEPTADSNFNAAEALQLERTLWSYVPLLADEELRIGKYCGAFGACNSALFMLYESRLRDGAEDFSGRSEMLQAVEQTSLRAVTLAEAAYDGRDESYPFEIHSPYLPYSLCQAAIVQWRLWKQDGDESHMRHFDSLRRIIKEVSKRWMVAWQYLDILDYIEARGEVWPPTVVPFQGLFISTGKNVT